MLDFFSFPHFLATSQWWEAFIWTESQSIGWILDDVVCVKPTMLRCLETRRVVFFIWTRLQTLASEQTSQGTEPAFKWHFLFFLASLVALHSVLLSRSVTGSLSRVSNLRSFKIVLGGFLFFVSFYDFKTFRCCWKLNTTWFSLWPDELILLSPDHLTYR